MRFQWKPGQQNTIATLKSNTPWKFCCCWPAIQIGRFTLGLLVVTGAAGEAGLKESTTCGRNPTVHFVYCMYSGTVVLAELSHCSYIQVKMKCSVEQVNLDAFIIVGSEMWPILCDMVCGSFSTNVTQLYFAVWFSVKKTFPPREQSWCEL